MTRDSLAELSDKQLEAFKILYPGKYKQLTRESKPKPEKVKSAPKPKLKKQVAPKPKPKPKVKAKPKAKVKPKPKPRPKKKAKVKAEKKVTVKAKAQAEKPKKAKAKKVIYHTWFNTKNVPKREKKPKPKLEPKPKVKRERKPKVKPVETVAFEGVLQTPKYFRDYAATFNAMSHRRGSPGHVTGQELIELMAKQSGRCYYCETDISVFHHLDHVFPVYLGGSSNIDNLVFACPRCNLEKSDSCALAHFKKVNPWLRK